jgi:inositol transport system substrate-binding protein
LALGSFTACAPKEEPVAAVKIGFAQCNLNDTFQTYVTDAATAKATELGYTIDVQDAQEDVVKQQDQVKAMIEQGYNAIIVVPVDTSAMGPITDAVVAAGIPLVYVNRNPFGTEEPPAGVYYVGSQEIVAGQFQADYLVQLLGTDKPVGVGILMGILSNEGAVKRTEGNKTVLAANANYTILAEEAGDWQSDKALAITENWLTAYGTGLNAILANNDGMAQGAIQALEAAGRTDVLVMGVDAIPDAIKLVADGKMAATVLQDAKGQGAGGVDVVTQILAGTAPAPVTWIDFVLVTPENVADFQ